MSSVKWVTFLSFAYYVPVRSYVRIFIRLSTVLQQDVCPAVMSILYYDMSGNYIRIVFCLVKMSVYNSKR